MNCFSTILALGLAVLAAVPLEAQAPANLERPGRHSRIVLHPADLQPDLAARLADLARGIAEGFWPTLQSVLGVVEAKPRAIHLYRDEKEFREVEKGGSPYPFAADSFTAKTGEAHVLLWPVLPVELLEHAQLSQWTTNNLLRVRAEQAVPEVAASDDWLRWVLVMGAVEAATNPTFQPRVDSRYDYRRRVVVSRRTRGIDMSLQLLINPGHSFRERWEIEWAETCGAVLAQLLATKD